MPTSNPKVSAYIPQHLYDLFTVFCDERKVSMSKGVALLFSEYFGAEQVVDHLGKNQPTDLRLQELEEKVSSLLSGLNSELPNKIDNLSSQLEFLSARVRTLETTSEPLSSLSSKLRADDTTTSIESQNTSELPSEPLVIPQDNHENLDSLQGKPEPVLHSEPPVILEPLSSTVLSAKRFRLYKDTVRGKKRVMTSDEFYEWTKEKDDDSIAWKYVESPKKGYLPADELPSELLQRLVDWIDKNK